MSHIDQEQVPVAARLFPYSGRNRAKSTHPYAGASIKDGLEEVRWRYPKSEGDGEVHVVDGTPFTGDITRAVPIRIGSKYLHRTYHEGLYVVGQTRQQVWYESMAEYVALMQIEHTMSVASVASQPCCFLFRGEMAHYPDYAVKTTVGDTIIIDVHDMQSTGLRDVVKFNRTAHVCEQLGWGYTVIEPLRLHEERNLVWLAGYRHWYAVPDPELEVRILDAASAPIGLVALARKLDPDLEWRHLPAVYHLMFTGVLGYDSALPLDDGTLVWKA
ncbi:TnsA-like heteromeric transposase endonuclease subunit [Arthrobacter sp. GCM10027362]|uniref:TnsA-like heteromeric transposase endonuclease subunit n=1 Tax=Arthrobacter sp. GCM10027362 TaxID=3273379 RepID=UPI0036410031